MILFGAIIATGLLKQPRLTFSATIRRPKILCWGSWTMSSLQRCDYCIPSCRTLLKSYGAYCDLEAVRFNLLLRRKRSVWIGSRTSQENGSWFRPSIRRYRLVVIFVQKPPFRQPGRHVLTYAYTT